MVTEQRSAHLCFADGNEGGKMGSTVTAAVIGIIVPMGECGLSHCGEERNGAQSLGKSTRKAEHLAHGPIPLIFFCPSSLPPHLTPPTSQSYNLVSEPGTQGPSRPGPRRPGPVHPRSPPFTLCMPSM